MMFLPYPGLRLKILAAAAGISNNTQSKEKLEKYINRANQKVIFFKERWEKQTTLLTTASNCHSPPKKKKKGGNVC